MKRQDSVPAPTSVDTAVPRVLAGPRPASRREAELCTLREVHRKQVVPVVDHADRLDQPRPSSPDLAPEDDLAGAPTHGRTVTLG